MKISRNNIVLLAILVIAGFYAYFFEYKHTENTKKEAEQAKVLLDFAPDSISAIKLKNIFGEFYFQKSESGAWMLEKPVKTRADEEKVKSILSDFAGIKRSGDADPFKATELQSYGFGNVAGIVRFQWGDKVDSLFLGDETPVGNNVFATKGDSTVYVVPKYKKNSITKNLYDYRDKKILHYSQSAIDQIEIISGKVRVNLEKKKGQKWTVNGVRADENKVNTLLSRFANNNFKKVLSESFDGKSYHLKRPLKKMILHETEAALKHALIIGSKADDKTVVAKDEDRPMVFTVDSSLANKINPELNYWRDHQFVEFNSGIIDSLVFRLPDSSIVLFKDSTQWFWKADTGAVKIKNWKVSSLLSDLKNLKISGFMGSYEKAGARYGLKQPAIRIDGFASTLRKFTTSYGKQRGKKRYAISNYTEEVVSLPNEDIEKLIPRRKDFIQ